MTVDELLEVLIPLPPDAQVRCYDGYGDSDIVGGVEVNTIDGKCQVMILPYEAARDIRK
jgi:hypothetical protein